jgi:hypothetical protein
MLAFQIPVVLRTPMFIMDVDAGPEKIGVDEISQNLLVRDWIAM